MYFSQTNYLAMLDSPLKLKADHLDAIPKMAVSLSSAGHAHAHARSFPITGGAPWQLSFSSPLALSPNRIDQGVFWSSRNWRPQLHPLLSLVPGRHVLPSSPFRTETLILLAAKSVVC